MIVFCNFFVAVCKMKPELFYKVVINSLVFNKFFKKSGTFNSFVSIIKCIYNNN